MRYGNLVALSDMVDVRAAVLLNSRHKTVRRKKSIKLYIRSIFYTTNIFPELSQVDMFSRNVKDRTMLPVR